MPAVAALMPGAEASLALRRTLPAGSSWTVIGCRSAPQLATTLTTRLVDAVVFAPTRTPLAEIALLRSAFPQVPWIAFAPFRPDDGALLLACQSSEVALVLVDGVDNAVAGDLVVRHSAAAHRRGAEWRCDAGTRCASDAINARLQSRRHEQTHPALAAPHRSE